MSEGRRVVTAPDMARAVERDPQFRLPVRPKFVEGVVVLPVEGGLLIEGAAERQVLRGRATQSLLPRLLPLLDGTRSLDNLAAELPDVPAQAIQNAVSLLYTRGLLEEGQPTLAEHAGIPEELLAFFRRHVDVTRVNRTGLDAALRLQSARLVVVGDERLGLLLAGELRRMGIHSVHARAVEAVRPDTTLVVALQAGTEDAEFLGAVDRACGEYRIPWLRSACTSHWLEIGPLFERDEICCYACFGHSRELEGAALPPDDVSERQWLSLVAVQTVYLVSRICHSPAFDGVQRFGLADWAQSYSKPLVQPGCEQCCPLSREGRRPPEPAYALEQSVRLTSKHRINPRDHQVHYKVENIELQQNHKHYPSAPVIPLPSPVETPRPGGGYPQRPVDADNPGHGSLDMAALTGLLVRSGGVRSQPGGSFQKVQRWAPTGGNLGSVQMYVLSLSVEGLSTGPYYYDPIEHVLVPLPWESSPAEQETALARLSSSGLIPSCSALLILTAALDKVTHKYGPFAYRVVHLDAGVAIAQARAVALAYGLECRPLARWNDLLLGEILGLDADHEPITAVMTLERCRM